LEPSKIFCGCLKYLYVGFRYQKPQNSSLRNGLAQAGEPSREIFPQENIRAFRGEAILVFYGRN